MKSAPRGHGCRALTGNLKHSKTVCKGSRVRSRWCHLARQEVPVVVEGAVRPFVGMYFFDDVTGAEICVGVHLPDVLRVGVL